MKEVGDLLQVSARTVAFHKYTIMEQLGVKTSAELVQYALEHGMLKRAPELARERSAALVQSERLRTGLPQCRFYRENNFPCHRRAYCLTCSEDVMRIAAARRRAQGRAVPFIKTESDRESSATSRYGCRCGEVRPGAFHAASINGCRALRTDRKPWYDERRAVTLCPRARNVEKLT
jgi:hypothetical protein